MQNLLSGQLKLLMPQKVQNAIYNPDNPPQLPPRPRFPVPRGRAGLNICGFAGYQILGWLAGRRAEQPLAGKLHGAAPLLH